MHGAVTSCFLFHPSIDSNEVQGNTGLGGHQQAHENENAEQSKSASPNRSLGQFGAGAHATGMDGDHGDEAINTGRHATSMQGDHEGEATNTGTHEEEGSQEGTHGTSMQVDDEGEATNTGSQEEEGSQEAKENESEKEVVHGQDDGGMRTPPLLFTDASNNENANVARNAAQGGEDVARHHDGGLFNDDP